MENKKKGAKTNKTKALAEKKVIKDKIIVSEKEEDNYEEIAPAILTEAEHANEVFSANDSTEEKEEQSKKKKKAPLIKLKTKADILEDLERYRPKKEKGLSSKQVADRKASGLINDTAKKSSNTYTKIVFKNIFTFFNILCLLIAVALVAVEAYRDLVFMLLVLINTTISIVQEVKAKNIIDKLTISTSNYCKVIRNGSTVLVPKQELVLDDVIFLTIGMQVPSDCISFDDGVEVNEAILTGESIPVKKKKGEMLLAGSFVSSGSCYARVENIGVENYIEKLSNRAKKYTRPKSELLYSMKILIRVVAIIIIPFAYLMFSNNYEYFNSDIAESVRKTAGSIIGMVPAGMFLLTTMALAVGVIRLAKKRTLVQELYCIEMLARANILCLDKTGTLTDGSMKVSDIIEITNIKDKLPLEQIMSALLSDEGSSNQTSQALRNYFKAKKEVDIEKMYAFSSEKKYSAVKIAGHGTYKLGAAEYLITKPEPLLQRKIDEFSAKGLRVLALVSASSYESTAGKPLALITLEDNIRKDAPETIKWFKENGVALRVISGDNPLTVSEIARRVGIDNHEKYISLQGLSKEEVMKVATEYTIFGRVSPEQKATLIKAMKEAGNTVAMTGDGVNDILALKEADCSIAVAAGSQAARSVSHLVLLDSNFSSMPTVVKEGRRVINNIQKSSILFLMKTVFVFLLSAFVLISSSPYPFSTIQFLPLEFCVIGLPSFFLALQPNTNIIKGKFLSNILKIAVPAGIVMSLAVISSYFYQDYSGILDTTLTTMGSISITAFGAVVLFTLCKPFNMYKGILFASTILLLSVLYLVIPTFFEYIPMTFEQTLFTLVVIQASFPLFNIVKKAFASIRVKDLPDDIVRSETDNIFVKKEVIDVKAEEKEKKKKPASKKEVDKKKTTAKKAKVK